MNFFRYLCLIFPSFGYVELQHYEEDDESINLFEYPIYTYWNGKTWEIIEEEEFDKYQKRNLT